MRGTIEGRGFDRQKREVNRDREKDSAPAIIGGGEGMGFLNAVMELGRMEAEMLAKRQGEALEDDPYRDIADFLSLPLPLDSKEKGQLIRVWLKVRNVEETLADENAILDVEGIDRIDRVEYGAGGDTPDPEAIKKKLLYRDPAGSNTTWAYAPIYKLGKGKGESASAKKELIGEKDWSTDKDTRLYKLRKNVLEEYERFGIWNGGAARKILEALSGSGFLDRLAELWNSPKASYALVFGVTHENSFLWPGEIPQYRRYFISKLNGSSEASHKPSSQKAPQSSWVCSGCGTEMEQTEKHANLDEIFAFATFDKPGFLPGFPSGNNDAAARRKVWPLCRSCCGLMSRGRNYIDRLYMRSGIIHDMSVFVVPELLFLGDRLQQLDSNSQDFLATGIRLEEKFFSYLARQGEGLVFHFMFWEKNNAQELVHLMVEDVPPTRLKKLALKWSNSVAAYPFPIREGAEVEERNNLDYAIRAVVSLFLSQGAKGEEEKKWLRDKALNILGRLLGGETIDIMGIKALAVSRFPGNFADPEWVKYAGIHTLDMARVVDFLIRSNER